ncbi:hypothetical protein HDU76_003822 [Blyttiomyces sp. JEL0837]|nr:hypothetical protein HDU76_003822 [Blyttiomyces sp. JEL0837]
MVSFTYLRAIAATLLILSSSSSSSSPSTAIAQLMTDPATDPANVNSSDSMTSSIISTTAIRSKPARPAAPTSVGSPILPLGGTPSANRQLAILEPPNGKMILGAGAFQLAQNIPVTTAPTPLFPPNTKLYANLTDLSEGTDAILFLTVYPIKGFDAVTDSALNDLANQLNQIKQNYSRSIMLRYGPEMNGNWFAYGAQPDAFVSAWTKLATVIKAQAPHVALVWSPNYDPHVDSYTQYWPGPDLVDWVGLSVYWKGLKSGYPWHTNVEAPSDYMAQIIDGFGNEGGTTSFYKLFADKYQKPFVLSETAAAFMKNYTVDNGPVTQAETGNSNGMHYFNSFLFNPTFWQQYPLLKMVNLFEFEKLTQQVEIDANYAVERDFRVTVGDSLDAFKAGLQQLDQQGKMVWANVVSKSANSTNAVTATVTTSGGSNSGGSQATGGATGNSNNAPLKNGAKVGKSVGGSLVAAELGVLAAAMAVGFGL